MDHDKAWLKKFDRDFLDELLMAKKTKTEAEKAYHSKIAGLGCILCESPAQVHHLREGQGMGQRNHWLVIPLCPRHHTERHERPDMFRIQHGGELYLLGKTLEKLFDSGSFC